MTLGKPEFMFPRYRGERLTLSSPRKCGDVQRKRKQWRRGRRLQQQGEKWTRIAQIGHVVHTPQVELLLTITVVVHHVNIFIL